MRHWDLDSFSIWDNLFAILANFRGILRPNLANDHHHDVVDYYSISCVCYYDLP